MKSGKCCKTRFVAINLNESCEMTKRKSIHESEDHPFIDAIVSAEPIYFPTTPHERDTPPSRERPNSSGDVSRYHWPYPLGHAGFLLQGVFIQTNDPKEIVA